MWLYRRDSEEVYGGEQGWGALSWGSYLFGVIVLLCCWVVVLLWWLVSKYGQGRGSSRWDGWAWARWIITWFDNSWYM